jgi:hypothetical protein
MKRYTCNAKTYRSMSSYTRWGIFTNVNDWGGHSHAPVLVF